MANKLTLIKLSVMYDLETEVGRSDGSNAAVAATVAVAGRKGTVLLGRTRCSSNNLLFS